MKRKSIILEKKSKARPNAFDITDVWPQISRGNDLAFACLVQRRGEDCTDHETREMASSSSTSSAAAAAVGRAVEEVQSALNEHADVVAELFGRVSTELRGGFAPAVDTFVGFFHAVDWKVRPLFSPLWFARILLGIVPPGSSTHSPTTGHQCARPSSKSSSRN